MRYSPTKLRIDGRGFFVVDHRSAVSRGGASVFAPPAGTIGACCEHVPA